MSRANSDAVTNLAPARLPPAKRLLRPCIRRRIAHLEQHPSTFRLGVAAQKAELERDKGSERGSDTKPRSDETWFRQTRSIHVSKHKDVLSKMLAERKVKRTRPIQTILTPCSRCLDENVSADSDRRGCHPMSRNQARRMKQRLKMFRHAPVCLGWRQFRIF